MPKGYIGLETVSLPQIYYSLLPLEMESSNFNWPHSLDPLSLHSFIPPEKLQFLFYLAVGYGHMFWPVNCEQIWDGQLLPSVYPTLPLFSIS